MSIMLTVLNATVQYIFTKHCKNVPIKVAIAISIAMGFVFLIVYFSGDMPAPLEK